MSTGVVPSKKVSEAPMHGAGIGIWLTTVMAIAGLALPCRARLSAPPQPSQAAHPSAASAAGIRKAATHRLRFALFACVCRLRTIVFRLRPRQRRYAADGMLSIWRQLTARRVLL